MPKVMRRIADPMTRDPMPTRGRISAREAHVVAWFTLAAVVVVAAAVHGNAPPYSTDSWGYFELSKGVGSDFFRINTYRSWQDPELHGSSFAPLWPVVIHFVDVVTSMGARSGMVANLAIALGTACFVEVYGRRALGVVALGPVVGLALMAFPPYADEVLSGRSLPLALALIAGALWASTLQGSRRALALGALAGALALTRSDLLPALVLLAAVAYLKCRREFRAVAIAVLVAVLVVSPWVAYGMIHFGTPFPSDNALIAAAVNQQHVRDVLDSQDTVRVLSDPLGWAQRVLGNVPEAGRAWALTVLESHYLFLTTVAGGGILLYGNPGATRRLKVLLVILASLASSVLLAELATGYFDARYLSPLVLVGSVYVFGRLLQIEDGRRWGLPLIVFVVLPAVACVAAQMTNQQSQPTLVAGATEGALRRCEVPGVIVISGDSTLAARYGALTGEPTGLMPSNLSQLTPAQLSRWATRYHISAAYYSTMGDEEAAEIAILSGVLRVTPRTCPGVIGNYYHLDSRTRGIQ